jgi:hypothetical protein
LQNALNYHQRGAAAWIHWLLGEINARSDFRGATEDHYSQAEALASQLGMAPLLAHCHFGRKFSETLDVRIKGDSSAVIRD